METQQTVTVPAPPVPVDVIEDSIALELLLTSLPE